MIKKLYPQGKAKAFSVSYDDGVLQDVRFVNLLNQYGLKGTFNLNSGLMENEFEWIHETGCIVKRLSKENVLSLYNGHEVASHTLTHPFMQENPRLHSPLPFGRGRFGGGGDASGLPAHCPRG